jgi:hypothetical protein
MAHPRMKKKRAVPAFKKAAKRLLLAIVVISY